MPSWVFHSLIALFCVDSAASSPMAKPSISCISDISDLPPPHLAPHRLITPRVAGCVRCVREQPTAGDLRIIQGTEECWDWCAYKRTMLSQQATDIVAFYQVEGANPAYKLRLIALRSYEATKLRIVNIQRQPSTKHTAAEEVNHLSALTLHHDAQL